jgi:hypothetical protein
MEDTAIATDNLHFDDETPGTQRYGSALRSPKFTELLQLIHFMPFEYALIQRHVTPTPRNRFWLRVNPPIKIMTNVMGQLMTFVTCEKIGKEIK